MTQLPTQNTPHKMLMADKNTIDLMVVHTAVAELKDILEAYDLKPGGKKSVPAHLRDEEVARVTALVEKYPQAFTAAPGGSLPNTAASALAALGDKLQVSLVSAAGAKDGKYAKIIQDDLDARGIKLVSDHGALAQSDVKTYISLVIGLDEGLRTIAKLDGDVVKRFSPDILTDELFNQQDSIMISGSLFKEFSEEFAEKFIEQTMRVSKNKEIILALPTSRDETIKHEEALLKLMSVADVVMSNEEEITHLFRPKGSVGFDLEHAIEKAEASGVDSLKTLRAHFKANHPALLDELDVVERTLKDSGADATLEAATNHIKWNNARLVNQAVVDMKTYIVANNQKEDVKTMTTLGKNGAKGLHITKDENGTPTVGFDQVNGRKPDALVNAVGAGDAAFAGFISALLDGASLKEAMEMAMEFGSKTVGVVQARHPDISTIYQKEVSKRETEKNHGEEKRDNWVERTQANDDKALAGPGF